DPSEPAARRAVMLAGMTIAEMEPPALPGVTHEHVDIPGVRVHVALAGAAAAPPVVLLHGWPQHWWCWRHVIPALAAAHRVVAPDLRGFGWSSAPRSGYDKEQLATDLLALMDALGIARAGLVGHDWGGWAGFLACLRAPDRFEAFLALSIPPPFHRVPRRAYLDAWRLGYQVVLSTPGAGTALLRTQPGLVARMVGGGATERANLTDAACALYARRLTAPDRARASALLYRTFLTRELPALARGRYDDARLRVPTLLLTGADDPAVRPVVLAGAERAAGTLRTRVIAGCGHFLPEERPDLVVAAARELF
ncbi:MAG TPA: alpha/beta fold hydrolase, partial [Solirubrobacteraceae bacterium]|nr:alpha/beta fold hydrolase [Solirubrobacteraceae bacterium]